MLTGKCAVFVELSVFVCVCAIVTVGCPMTGGDAVVYVDINTPVARPAQDGTSWATAFAEIQDGIDAAEEAGGGAVWVAQGIYNELRMNDPNGSLVMKSGVDLYGGFLGSESVRNARDWENNKTVIDGAFRAAAPKGEIPSNAHHVVKGADNATLDGFIITNGNGLIINNNPDSFGGGMFNSDVSPIVRHCTFFQNLADEGGAMYNESSDPTVSDCRFIGNYAEFYGGAVCNSSASPHITGCEFYGNSSRENGGDMHTRGECTPVIERCFFHDSATQGYGGSMCNVNCSAIITNCVFARHFAQEQGGAIDNETALVTITNCTFYGHLALLYSGAINNTPESVANIVNSIFWSNHVVGVLNDFDGPGAFNVTYSCTQSGVVGTGNIDLNPLFVDEFNNNFALLPGSACIDSGTDIGAPSGDIDNVPRPQGGGIDMGAHERRQRFS